jgi:structural maintenance of chromosome 3 (chondroitin sulfate proteoglycan 6)
LSYDSLLYQVFGKTFICRDIEVATQVASQYGTNCVTIDGDQVNKRGGITGGYIDRRSSRLAAKAALDDINAKLRKAGKDGEKVKETLRKTDHEISVLLTEMEKLEVFFHTPRLCLSPFLD